MTAYCAADNAVNSSCFHENFMLNSTTVILRHRMASHAVDGMEGLEKSTLFANAIQYVNTAHKTSWLVARSIFLGNGQG